MQILHITYIFVDRGCLYPVEGQLFVTKCRTHNDDQSFQPAMRQALRDNFPYRGFTISYEIVAVSLAVRKLSRQAAPLPPVSVLLSREIDTH